MWAQGKTRLGSFCFFSPSLSEVPKTFTVFVGRSYPEKGRGSQKKRKRVWGKLRNENKKRVLVLGMNQGTMVRHSDASVGRGTLERHLELIPELCLLNSLSLFLVWQPPFSLSRFPSRSRRLRGTEEKLTQG